MLATVPRVSLETPEAAPVQSSPVSGKGKGSAGELALPPSPHLIVVGFDSRKEDRAGEGLSRRNQC